MSDFVVSVDAGNGFTNGVRAKGRGYQSFGFPSVRGAVTGDSLGLGSQFEIDFEYVNWGGFRYAIGDDVFVSKSIERHQGAFRYGDEFWFFLVSVAIGKLLPKKGGSIDLTVFAPPSMYLEAKEQIAKRLEKSDYTIAIQFKNDKKPRLYQIENITVHPEGLGAVAAFVLDNKGNEVPSDILDGHTVVLDLGMYTLDALLLEDGLFNTESLQSATWEGHGIRAHVLERMLPKIKKAGHDFSVMTLDKLDVAIRNGIINDDYTLTSGNSKIDLQISVKKYQERYADFIANTIIDGSFNGLRGIRHMILVGGGATLVNEYLEPYYPDKILSFEDYPHVKSIPPIELNAVGGLRLALARQMA